MAEYLDCEISLDTRTIKIGSSVYTVQLNDNVDGIRFLLPVGISEYITLENPVVTLLYLAPGTSQGRTLTLSLGEDDGTYYFIYWTFETEFTQYAGVGTFSICIESFENAGDTSATGHWNSQPAKITVYPTMDHDDLVPSSDTEVTPAYIVAIENAVSSYMDDYTIEGSSVPSNVRTAIYTLLSNAAFDDDAVYTDELAIVQSWASEVTAITLNQSTISITGTGTYQLTATTTPSGGAVTWTSSDTSVATVSSSGLVTGVSNGTVTITASSGDVSATCTATVSGIATLTGIEAVYTQSGAVYTSASLSDLTSDLVVTATYDDSSTATLTSSDYTLSGTLTEGTSTITVTYGGFTDTFTVTVSVVDDSLYNWDFTTSLVDSKQSVTAELTNVTQDSDGLHWTSGTAGNVKCVSGMNSISQYTVEVDVTALNITGTSRFISFIYGTESDNKWRNGLLYNTTNGFYMKMKQGNCIPETLVTDTTIFDGKTMKVQFDITNNTINCYADDTLVFTVTNSTYIGSNTHHDIIGFGGCYSDKHYNHAAVITGFRIYEGLV